MNGAKIKRGTGSGGRNAPARPRGPRQAPRKQTRLDKIIALIPVSGQTLSRILTAMVVVLAAGVLWMLASFFGLPQAMGQQASLIAARSGFQVAKIEVQGLKRMDEMPVYTLALTEMDRSMLAVDLADLRRRVMTLGWVQDARITRRLPNTLVIDIVERDPVAVWQHGGKLSLIDVNGVELQTVDGRSMPDLPLVVGPEANRETKALQQLMGAAPALKPLLAGATWVGNRRWDLRFQSGETLALPEGDSAAAAALMKFAQLDGVNRLLGRGIVRFDMRDPSRFVLRLPPEAKTAAGAAGTATTNTTAPAKGHGEDEDERSPHTEAAHAQSGEA